MVSANTRRRLVLRKDGSLDQLAEADRDSWGNVRVHNWKPNPNVFYVLRNDGIIYPEHKDYRLKNWEAIFNFQPNDEIYRNLLH